MNQWASDVDKVKLKLIPDPIGVWSEVEAEAKFNNFRISDLIFCSQNRFLYKGSVSYVCGKFATSFTDQNVLFIYR